MKELKIFLGSSFRLMKQRKSIGTLFANLNTKWLNDDVRVRLMIWEDFLIGYSGKHKQQEYIEEMVLPSDTCIFLFSNRVGKYTRMELMAKLAQNKDACHVFRLKHNGTWIKSVADELQSIGVVYEDISSDSDLLISISGIVEKCIQDGVASDTTCKHDADLCFYTTIGNYVKTVCQHIDEDIDTQVRKIDDFTMDEWGIHCVLHPRKTFSLMDCTDHYIPMLANDVSDEDYRELEYGIDKSKDEHHRIKRMTIFDFGNVYNQNGRLRMLIDSKTNGGLFTDKVKSLGDVKFNLLDWIRKSKNQILSSNTTPLAIEKGNLVVDGTPFASMAAIDKENKTTALVAEVTQIEDTLEQMFSRTVDDSAFLQLSQKRMQVKGLVDIVLLYVLNDSSLQITAISEGEKELARQCEELDSVVIAKLSAELSVEDAKLLKGLLLKKEGLERTLLRHGCCSVFRLLITQYVLVALFDTFFSVFSQQEEEDILYGRIIDLADEYAVHIPFIEAIRMNRGNMFSRKSDYQNARKEYLDAIANLEKYKAKGRYVMRYITIVYVHLFHLEERYGTRDSMDDVMSLFEKHIHSLDVADEYHFFDMCMFVTSKLTGVDIYDEDSREMVEMAEEFFMEANKKQLSVDDELYGDIFVYMPNMIARYYIDHHAQYPYYEVSSLLIRAESLIQFALDNSERLRKLHFSEGLTYYGSLKHQLGYLLSFSEYRVKESIQSYDEALDARRRVYALSGNPNDELEVAQTLVNYGAVELAIAQNKYRVRGEFKLRMYEKACEALDIYKRHLVPGNLHSETRLYEAKLLYGTSLYQIFLVNKLGTSFYNQAISVLLDCWNWNKNNIANQYRETIFSSAGEILLKNGCISKNDFVEVKGMVGQYD